MLRINKKYNKSNLRTIGKSKIIIEPFLCDEADLFNEEIEWYCFNGEPKMCLRLEGGTNNKTTLYDEKLNIIYDTLSKGDVEINRFSDILIKQTFDLSKKLACPSEFKFVRIDFMIYRNRIYFEELTFSPYSGFSGILRKKFNKKLGELLHL